MYYQMNVSSLCSRVVEIIKIVFGFGFYMFGMFMELGFEKSTSYNVSIGDERKKKVLCR